MSTFSCRIVALLFHPALHAVTLLTLILLVYTISTCPVTVMRRVNSVLFVVCGSALVPASIIASSEETISCSVPS